MTLPRPTPEQQRILDMGLDNIRVRAGAGTGKTTTIAMVLANLVDNFGIEPEQAMGITFTNKAAAELAERVRLHIGGGVDPGRQVEVHTYHGFAAQVLSEFGPLVGVDGRFRVITPTFSRQLLNETFIHTSYTYLDITYQGTLDRIRRLGDRMGDHLVGLQTILDLPTEDEVSMKRAEMAVTLAAYDAEKRRLGVVDYADLVTLSVRVASEFPQVAETIRGRYEVVVLDEYQDTNPAQRVLLTSIFGDGFPVIAVGDEDQTIYEWRGASAENFENFPTHFPRGDGSPAHSLTLTLNRRSTQGILDVANQVRLRANPESDSLFSDDESPRGEVVTHWATDSLAEAAWIAERFEVLHQNGLSWKEMAVLLRKNRDFPVLVEALGRRGIPLEVANIGGLLAVPEVAELRAWLTLLERPEDSTQLIRILFGSKHRLGLADIAPLSRWVSAESREDAEDEQPISLIEAIEALDAIEEIRPEARSSLHRFADVYRTVLLESQGLTLIETARLILDRTRAWQDVEALPTNARLTARLNLYRFLDLAEDWSPLRGRPSLHGFLSYLETMEDEESDELDSARLSGEDAVTLVTVHRAKGLEWDTVAIPAVTKDNFPSRVISHPDPVKFPEHLPVHLRIDSVLDAIPADEKERKEVLGRIHYDQEWRVAYVAVTRAKTRLLVSGAHWYGLPEPTVNPRTPSELFELIADHPVSSNAGHAELTERPALLKVDPGTVAPDPLFANGWQTALRDAVDRSETIDDLAERIGVNAAYEQLRDSWSERLFDLETRTSTDVAPEPATISVTGLVTYARCPKQYFWSTVDPLPRRSSAAATRGTAIHRQIELHQRGHVPLDLPELDLYDLPVATGTVEGGFTAYLESRFANRQAALIEVPFVFALNGANTVRGRIDAVYVDEGHWEIVDFKSGKPSTDPSSVVQLQAYAVAAHEVDFGLEKPATLDVTFAHLSGGLEERTHHVDADWLDGARAALEAISSGVESGRFDESPREWCKSCDFLRFCRPGTEWASR